MPVLPSALSLVSNTGCLAQSSCSINLLNECSVAKVEGSESHSVMSNSLGPHGLIQSMEFSRPEYWSGQPFPSPGDIPNPEIKPRSPTLQADSLPAKP